MKPQIKIFKDTGEISDEIASILKSLVTKPNGEEIHIALSGGSTPKVIFEHLTKKYGKKLANPQFHFWWGDDRCVSATHNDSNYKWANELWLSPIGIPAENIHRISGENKPEEEAARYAAEIKKYVPVKNGLPVFDFMLLGLGEDGHTASVFPNQMELLESKKFCEVATHPQSGQKRITLTGNVINNSRIIAFLSTGEKKSQKVYDVITRQDASLPATHITPYNGELIWLLDKKAAALL